MAREDPARQNAALVWLVPFAALLLAGLALFAITARVEGVRIAWSDGPLRWLAQLDTGAAAESLSNAAEVVAAVLAIAITVVAIVVELAANRYTHRITQLFVREPVNGVVMGFFVLTALYCMWVSATLGGAAAEGAPVPHGAVAIALGMVTLSLLLLLPYFGFVFAFLQPLTVVDRIRAHAFRVVRRAARGYRHGLRAEMVMSLDQLEDVALNGMQHKDRGICLAAVEALYEFLHDYQSERDNLDEDWFGLDRSLARDPSFVAMAPRVREELAHEHLWVEMKVLRQYHTIYVDALNGMRGVAYLVSLNTHRIASEALQRGRLSVFDLGVRFFNSYLRAGINAGDVRTTYYTLHHYRGLAEDAVHAGENDRAVQIASYLRYYGQLAFAAKLPFVLEAVAYDMALVNEAAFHCGSPAAPALLEIFLTVDKETDSPAQESSLRGVRRAQVQLATFFLLRGWIDEARMVYRDMEHERSERLASIRDELLAEDQPDYWEVTDRGVNFGYLPPDRRGKVLEFFAWFGKRLPPPERGAAEPPIALPASPSRAASGRAGAG